MGIIRIEKWGSSYRLVAFKGSPLRGHKRRSERDPDKPPSADEGLYWSAKWIDELNRENERFNSSLVRARSRIRELAMCQQWEFFVTLTLSDEKQDRFDIKRWVKDLGAWIGNYNRKYNCKLQYLLIPEQHKNGAWHAHGIFRGLAPESLERNEHGYLEIPYYRRRFGFINMSPIRDNKRTASYITKYVTKAGSETARHMEKGAHLFYASRGLAGKEVIWQGCGDFEGGFENEWCRVKFIEPEEARAILERYASQAGGTCLCN